MTFFNAVLGVEERKTLGNTRIAASNVLPEFLVCSPLWNCDGEGFWWR
jgi:hypothetical protein